MTLNSRPKLQTKKGFTLIELLVVIAIIALLLSILLPSLQIVKRKARDVICRSNLRQWGLIWKMFTDNNNGKFAGETLKGGVGWIRGQWAADLRKYWQDQGRQKLLMCPSAKKPQPGFVPETGENNWGGPNNTYQVSDSDVVLPDGTREIASYGMNLWAFNRTGAQQSNLQGRKNELHWGQVDVRGPAKIPLFLDSMWRGGGPYYYNGGPTSRYIKPPRYNGQWGDAHTPGNDFQGAVQYEMQHFCIDRHNHAINGVFFDLSTRKIPLKHLWKLKWHKTFDTRGYPANGGVWPPWMQSFKE